MGSRLVTVLDSGFFDSVVRTLIYYIYFYFDLSLLAAWPVIGLVGWLLL
jgi:hypothetical protein